MKPTTKQFGVTLPVPLIELMDKNIDGLHVVGRSQFVARAIWLRQTQGIGGDSGLMWLNHAKACVYNDGKGGKPGDGYCECDLWHDCATFLGFRDDDGNPVPVAQIGLRVRGDLVEYMDARIDGVFFVNRSNFIASCLVHVFHKKLKPQKD